MKAKSPCETLGTEPVGTAARPRLKRIHGAGKASTEGVRGAVLRPAVRVPVPSALSLVPLARCDQGLRVRWQTQAHVANWVRA